MSPFTGFRAPVMSVYKPLCSRFITSRPPSAISSLVSMRLPPLAFESGTAYMEVFFIKLTKVRNK